MREGRTPQYPGTCRHLDPATARARVDAGEPAAIRFRVSDAAAITFTDLVRGPITTDAAMIGDFVLLRQNGLPAYNFAVVVDDLAMQISLVIRGEDHVPNTPRQILLYRALGAEPRSSGTVAVLGHDHAPLSKRHGASSVADFRARGILPEALRNYLALLGWSPGHDEEIVAVDELARRFRVEDVTRSAGVFDPDKLSWMNRHYLKQAEPDRVARLLAPHLTAAGYLSGGESRYSALAGLPRHMRPARGGHRRPTGGWPGAASDGVRDPAPGVRGGASRGRVPGVGRSRARGGGRVRAGTQRAIPPYPRDLSRGGAAGTATNRGEGAGPLPPDADWR